VDYSNLSIGSHVHIGKEVFLDLTERLIIEDSAAIAMRAVLLTHVNIGTGYRNKPMARLFPKKHKPTILRRGCSIGTGAVIACGVEIGEDAVINAGVVVDRDVPPRTIVFNTRPRKPMQVPDRFFKKPAGSEEPQSSSEEPQGSQ
jgi:acetyltransferase-like isoleucine patch superfamily enzyme